MLLFNNGKSLERIQPYSIAMEVWSALGSGWECVQSVFGKQTAGVTAN